MEIWQLRSLVLTKILAHFGFDANAILNASEEVLEKTLLDVAPKIISDHQMLNEHNVIMMTFSSRKLRDEFTAWMSDGGGEQYAWDGINADFSYRNWDEPVVEIIVK